jgi:hypothetical protein
VLGASYEGAWADASTFVISILDGAGSKLHTQLGIIYVNPLPALRNAGCRPGVTTRNGEVLSYRGGTSTQGMCNSAHGFAGPIVSRKGAGGDGAFVAQFGVRPAVHGVVIVDPDHGDAVLGAGDEVHVLFDQATDRGRGANAGDRSYVDALFSFSLPLGLQYMGACAARGDSNRGGVRRGVGSRRGLPWPARAAHRRACGAPGLPPVRCSPRARRLLAAGATRAASS